MTYETPMRVLAVTAVLFGVASKPNVAPAQTISAPQVLGPIVGPGTTFVQSDLALYGTDLGWTFLHDGRHVILFGDTWSSARALCDGEPLNDDTLALLPAELPNGFPGLAFPTRPEAPDQFAPLVLTRGAEPLPLGYGRVPLAGFSDGRDAVAIFGRGEVVRCVPRGRRGRPSCRPHRHLACTQEVGECTGGMFQATALCDLASGAGCLPGTTCAASATGFCVDETSSQNDGTAASLRYTVAHDQEIAVRDPPTGTAFRSVARIATNKFINLTARTVRCFTGKACGNDYGQGSGALLVWGRPGFTAEQGRQAQIYLMAHPLPLEPDGGKRSRFRPRYFAGVSRSGAPRWTGRESRAVPLALDGVVGGSPHEEQPIVAQLSVSWIGHPVNKWMMLYGGDLADYLLLDPATARPGAAPGAIRARFADHPWGPWSAPVPHLLPGAPAVAGDLYGPGGALFHPLCQDAPPALCAPGDPTRPPDVFLPGCPSFAAAFDQGRLYGPNIIDAWTQPDGAGGATVFWNVSTWNPYGVVLVRSTVTPAAGGPAAACATAPASRLRWCASGS